MVSRLPLAGGEIDRAAHRRRDAAWLAEAWTRAQILIVSDGATLVRGAAGDGGGAASNGGGGAAGVGGAAGGKAELVLFGPAEAPVDAERYFLGVDQSGTPYFAVSAPLPKPSDPVRAAELSGARSVTLREAGDLLCDRDGSLFVTAVALASWHGRHKYSPVDGQPTSTAEAGWSRVTEAAGDTHWPRTDPAVIMLVHDGVAGPGGRCLLATNAAWQPMAGIARYSCLAGFVEPGESAEQAVVRETREEVGVELSDVRYVASQPWPFPGSLMLGFVALADPAAEIRVDDDEITDARWFTRTEISAVLSGRPGGITLPMGLSIARYLISEWATSEWRSAESGRAGQLNSRLWQGPS